MTYEEQVSELFQANWRMADIASLTPWIRRALFLPRDKYGRLKREDPDLPPGVEVDDDGKRVIKGKRATLAQVFKQVNLERGLSLDQIKDAWAKFREQNPDMGKGGKRERRKLR